MMNKVSGVYAIFHNPSGRAYVGSSVDIRRRVQEHRRALARGTHTCKPLLWLWQNEEASAFSFRLIAEAHPSYLAAAEQLAMNRFQSSGQLLNQMAASRQGATQHKRQVLADRFNLYYNTAVSTGWLAKLAGLPGIGLIIKGMARTRAHYQVQRFAAKIKA